MNGLRTAATLLFRNGRCLEEANPLKTEIALRVMPWDLHLRVAHMDSYGFFMELGRWDQVKKLGFLRLIFREGCAPFTQIQTIRFSKPLRLFQKFTVTTEVVHLDEEFTYNRHAIYSNGNLICYGLIKYVLIGKNGRISSERLYGERFAQFKNQKVPDYILELSRAEGSLFRSLKKE